MKDLENLILFQLDKTNKIVKQYSQRKFDELNLGLTIEQWIILKIIYESGAESQKSIAELSHRDPASITRTLDLLAKKSFIKREHIPDNRRQFKIILTKTGEQFVEKQMPMVNEQRKQSIKGFNKSELDLLKSFLMRIQKNMV